MERIIAPGDLLDGHTQCPRKSQSSGDIGQELIRFNVRDNALRDARLSRQLALR